MAEPEVLPPEPSTKRAGPLPWRLRAAWRLLRDPRAKAWEKALLAASVAYVVFPVDLVPDVPIVGWLDDLGVVALAAAALHRALARYRT